MDYGSIRGRFPALGKLVFGMAFFTALDWLCTTQLVNADFFFFNSEQTAVQRNWFFVSADVRGGGTRVTKPQESLRRRLL